MTFRPFSPTFLFSTGLLFLFSWSARGAVSLGIDELEKSNFAILQGKHVGLVTNPSGADSKGRSAIAVFFHANGFHLVKLFGPEHGIDGKTGAGLHVSSSRDRATGLPVCSLYGDTRRPTPQMLAGIDTLVYDVQDLGNRSYTFISTLGYLMEEASKYNIGVVVLDRPNPLGGARIEGPRLDPTAKSFVGLYDIPFVYGLTPGELAQWINAKYLTQPCKLTVVTMKGWSRSMVWEDTGLRWIPTSPYVPTIAAARGYAATGILGEIGIESGLETPYPFQVFSGRGWDSNGLARRFNALHVPGVQAKPYNYGNLNGVYLHLDPRNAGNLTAINLQIIQVIQRTVSGYDPFARTTRDQRDMFNKVTGDPRMRPEIASGRPASDIIHSWDAGVVHWAIERLPYLLYTTKPAGAAPAPNVMADTSEPAP